MPTDLGAPGPALNPTMREKWVSKKAVARHYGYTTRWVEMRMAEGMPSRPIGGQRRFLLSLVDAWLEQWESERGSRRK